MFNKRNVRGQKKTDDPAAMEVTRLEFLKLIAVGAAGATLGTVTAGCKSQASTESISATDPASSPPDSTPAISDSTSVDWKYIPPTTLAPVITIAGTSCAVATDRLYSTDHIWVKQIKDNHVVIGITLSMFHILYNPWRCALSQQGTTLAKGESFGETEGYKMTVDLTSPVSGTVTQVNPLVIGIVDNADGMIADLADPFNKGWMMAIQLSKPAELGSLMSPQQYGAFIHE